MLIPIEISQHEMLDARKNLFIRNFNILEHKLGYSLSLSNPSGGQHLFDTLVDPFKKWFPDIYSSLPIKSSRMVTDNALFVYPHIIRESNSPEFTSTCAKPVPFELYYFQQKAWTYSFFNKKYFSFGIKVSPIYISKEDELVNKQFAVEIYTTPSSYFKEDLIREDANRHYRQFSDNLRDKIKVRTPQDIVDQIIFYL